MSSHSLKPKNNWPKTIKKTDTQEHTRSETEFKVSFRQICNEISKIVYDYLLKITDTRTRDPVFCGILTTKVLSRVIREDNMLKDIIDRDTYTRIVEFVFADDNTDSLHPGPAECSGLAERLGLTENELDLICRTLTAMYISLSIMGDTGRVVAITRQELERMDMETEMGASVETVPKSQTDFRSIAPKIDQQPVCQRSAGSFVAFNVTPPPTPPARSNSDDNSDDKFNPDENDVYIFDIPDVSSDRITIPKTLFEPSAIVRPAEMPAHRLDTPNRNVAPDTETTVSKDEVLFELESLLDSDDATFGNRGPEKRTGIEKTVHDQNKSTAAEDRIKNILRYMIYPKLRNILLEYRVLETESLGKSTEEEKSGEREEAHGKGDRVLMNLTLNYIAVACGVRPEDIRFIIEEYPYDGRIRVNYETRLFAGDINKILLAVKTFGNNIDKKIAKVREHVSL